MLKSVKYVPNMPPTVTVSIVSYNHAAFLPTCLEAVRSQSMPLERVVVSDNGSTDGSSEWLREHASDLDLRLNEKNLGYAAAHNRAFHMSDSNYVLALNCDVVLERQFLEHIVSELEAQPGTGSACGRLLLGTSGQAGTLDSTGLFPDRFRRFRDRDHAARDNGQRTSSGFIFGPSGSAAVFRRAMLKDVAFDGQYFDEDLFAYYEDADLAWRAQRRGWKSMFVPKAKGWHVHDDLSRARSGRKDAEARSRQLLLISNRHLCFIRNDRWSELARDVPWILGYDLALEAYLLITKPGLALRWPLDVSRSLGRTLVKRRADQAEAKTTVFLSSWFHDETNPADG